MLAAKFVFFYEITKKKLRKALLLGKKGIFQQDSFADNETFFIFDA